MCLALNGTEVVSYYKRAEKKRTKSLLLACDRKTNRMILYGDLFSCVLETIRGMLVNITIRLNISTFFVTSLGTCSIYFRLKDYSFISCLPCLPFSPMLKR